SPKTGEEAKREQGDRGSRYPLRGEGSRAPIRMWVRSVLACRALFFIGVEMDALSLRPFARALSTLGRIVLRGSIALILLGTALGKFLDIGGFEGVVDSYRVFPQAALALVAWAIPLAEVALGIWLFSGRGLLRAALCSVAIHVGYVAWTSLALMRD